MKEFLGDFFEEMSWRLFEKNHMEKLLKKTLKTLKYESLEKLLEHKVFIGGISKGIDILWEPMKKICTWILGGFSDTFHAVVSEEIFIGISEAIPDFFFNYWGNFETKIRICFECSGVRARPVVFGNRLSRLTSLPRVIWPSKWSSILRVI